MREPEYDEFVIENKRIFMTHGHLYGVKTSLDALMNEGFVRHADILLFGHTHIPYYKVMQRMCIVNPGSAGREPKTYAVLEIEHGAINCRIVKINN
jgi:putative phosphoesterase